MSLEDIVIMETLQMCGFCEMKGANHCFHDADFHKLLTHQGGECGII